MGKEFRVAWTNIAKHDLRRMIEYISFDSTAKALDVYQRIRLEAESLQELPLRGRTVPELRFNGVLLYRELIVPSWRLIYRIDGANVWVLAVIDSRRDITDILLERLIDS